MSDTNAQEPTMEEILASIRRIISEDDAPAGAAAPAAAAAVAEAEPEPVPEPEAVAEAPVAAVAAPPPVLDEGDDDDVLELTQPAPPLHTPEPEPVAVDEPADRLGDIEVFPRAAPQPAPAPKPQPVAVAPAHEDGGLSSHPTANLAATAFGQLSRTVAMPAEGRTIEDVVRELLRPMLKDWLDHNLPDIVETAVQSEVERISRLRRF